MSAAQRVADGDAMRSFALEAGVLDGAWVEASVARSAVRRAELIHLANPWLHAQDLAVQAEGTLDDVLEAYRAIRDDPALRTLTKDAWYPRRHMHGFGEVLVGELQSEPGLMPALRAGTPVVSKTLEIHATAGSCALFCAMCLWATPQHRQAVQMTATRHRAFDFWRGRSRSSLGRAAKRSSSVAGAKCCCAPMLRNSSPMPQPWVSRRTSTPAE